MNRAQWIVLLAAWLGWGFDCFDALLFNFVAPNCIPTLLGIPIGSKEAAEVVPYWNGVFSSLLLIGWATGGILFGKVADRLGRTRTLMLTMAMYSLGTAACAFAPNLAVLAVFRLIASLGIGGEWAAGAAMVAEVVPERRRVEAYHLGCIDNQWYLIGHDLVRGQRRTFAITRLSAPKILKQKFQRPSDFSMESMMNGSFSAFETPKPSRVVIRLDAFATRLAAERVWHKSQKIKPLAGGGSEMTLEVGLAPDLENWILGWGNHAKVLEPNALCERIASIARSMALQYTV
jgi:hypothetical protein